MQYDTRARLLAVEVLLACQKRSATTRSRRIRACARRPVQWQESSALQGGGRVDGGYSR